MDPKDINNPQYSETAIHLLKTILKGGNILEMDFSKYSYILLHTDELIKKETLNLKQFNKEEFVSGTDIEYIMMPTEKSPNLPIMIFSKDGKIYVQVFDENQEIDPNFKTNITLALIGFSFMHTYGITVESKEPNTNYFELNTVNDPINLHHQLEDHFLRTINDPNTNFKSINFGLLDIL